MNRLNLRTRLRLRPLRIALLVLATLAQTPAHAAPERLCGWLWNPTPGNYFLKDRAAEWVIASQGQDDDAADLDVMPDMTTGGWVETNGHYGYGCACITADVSRLAARVLHLVAAEPMPLARCRADRTLPPP